MEATCPYDRWGLWVEVDDGHVAVREGLSLRGVRLGD